jgi:hypothetical protein
MPLELWIFLGVIAAGAVGAFIIRLRRKRAREAAAETGSESNVYPLW